MTPTSQFIAGFEGCRLQAYQDQGGVWTIGYGQTGRTIHPGLTWTQDQADSALEHTVSAVQSVVQSMVTVPLTDNELTALTSLAYNVGTGSLASSQLLRKLNEGRYSDAADEFTNGWNTAGGVFSQGLQNRRMAERALFLKS